MATMTLTRPLPLNGVEAAPDRNQKQREQPDRHPVNTFDQAA